MTVDGELLEFRVLVLAPTGKDADLTRSVLARAGVACHCCMDFPQVCEELERGAGAVILVEEAVVSGNAECLVDWVARQPSWSDLPILLMARPMADSATVAQSMDLFGNITVLERPARVAAMVSAVRAALRARRRQYQIREHVAELKRGDELLRDADRRKDEFLAILAHELRNPLAPIRNSLHILRLTSRHDSATDRMVEVMERQVNHMVRLIDELMEVSRITRGKIELRKEWIDVTSIVNNAVETSRPLIEAAGHQFTVAIPPEPLILEGDPLRLTQVLANLLNNAAKYTDAGGQIWLSVWRDANEVAISVRDTGTGMTTEMIPRIFDLFTQVDHRDDRSLGGLGIGLTLVKSLVEMHGGNVQAISEGEGQGSDFIVRLPLADSAPPSAIAPANDASARVLGPRRVLVVDDNRDAADSLGTLLKLLGADVRIVYNGRDALETFSHHRPDVAILDLGMPGMDGYELARRIRQKHAFPDVTLIALTGWGQEADRLRSQYAGFDHHLMKPADLKTLETLLASLEGDSKIRQSSPLAHASHPNEQANEER